jgi:hypothetical protein
MWSLLRARFKLIIATSLVAIIASAALPMPASALPLAAASVGGRGTATIDGVFAPGEWNGASRIDMSVNLPAFDGGGTTPGALYLMNDDTTLYMGFKVQRPSLAALVNLFYDFDNDHDGVVELGDDHVGGYAQFSTVWFIDLSRQTCPWGPCTTWDTDDGGTSDVIAAASNDGVWTYVEIAHGYRQDEAHDISARPVIGLNFSLNLWSIDPAHCNFGNDCAATTRLTPGGWLDLAIVPSDLTAPTIAGTAFPAPNARGWNRDPVDVLWTVADAESGIASTTGCGPRTLTADTAGTTITCTAVNGAGLTASSAITARIDRSAPALAYACVAPSVDIDGEVSCRLFATDALSGIKEVLGTDIQTPAWRLGPGEHVFSATAIDNADNIATASTRVTVTVTTDSLCTLTQRFVTNAGIAHSLCVKLADGAINAYRNEIAAQREKSLTAEESDALDVLASALSDR